MFDWIKKVFNWLFQSEVGTRVPVTNDDNEVVYVKSDDFQTASVPDVIEETATERRARLQKQVVTAWDAFNCCIKNRNDASRFVSEMENFMLEYGVTWEYGSPPRTGYVAPPGPALVPATRIGTAWYLGENFGFIEMLMGAAWVSVTAFNLPRTHAEARACASVLRAVATRLRERTEDGCNACVTSKCLRQDRPRETYLGTYRSRR